MEGTLSGDDSEHTDPSSDRHQPTNHPPNQREENDTTQQQQQQQIGAGAEQYQIPPDVANLVQAALYSENGILSNSLQQQPQDNRGMGISQINGQSLSQPFLPAAQPVSCAAPSNNDNSNNDRNALLAQFLQHHQLQGGLQGMQQTQQQHPVQPQQPTATMQQPQQLTVSLQGIAGSPGFSQLQQHQPAPAPQQASQQQMLELLAQLLGFCVSQLTQSQQQPQPSPQQQPTPFQFSFPPALLINMLLQGNAIPQQPAMPGFGLPAVGVSVGVTGGGGVTMAQAADTQQGRGALGAASQGPKKRRKYRHEAFPQKLHRLIREAMAEGKDHICRFTDDGTQFQVRDTEAFQTEILPRYFRHGRIDSFKRLLHMYGFRRIQGTCEYLVVRADEEDC